MRQLFLAAFLSTGFSLFDEPPRLSNRSLPWESGAEDARTPNASRLPGVFELREASGVRPINRRFPSGAERPAVHGPNAGEKNERGLSMNLAPFTYQDGQIRLPDGNALRYHNRVNWRPHWTWLV